MKDLDALINILSDEMKLLGQFIELNEIKRRLLFSNQADKLAKIIEEETVFADRIYDIVRRRNEAIEALCGSFGIEKPGLRALAERCAEGMKGKLMTARNAIMKRMNKLLELTDRNTFLIKSKVEMVEKIMQRVFVTTDVRYTPAGVVQSMHHMPFSLRKGMLA